MALPRYSRNHGPRPEGELLRRYLEAQRYTESMRLVGAVQDAHEHPGGARQFGLPAQIQPNEQADQEPEQRRQQVRESLLGFTDIVSNQCGGVDAHEGDEGAEIEQLGTELVGQGKSPQQCHYAYEQDDCQYDHL